METRCSLGVVEWASKKRILPHKVLSRDVHSFCNLFFKKNQMDVHLIHVNVTCRLENCRS